MEQAWRVFDMRGEGELDAEVDLYITLRHEELEREIEGTQISI